jgi:hypothetical protein
MNRFCALPSNMENHCRTVSAGPSALAVNIPREHAAAIRTVIAAGEHKGEHQGERQVLHTWWTLIMGDCTLASERAVLQAAGGRSNLPTCPPLLLGPLHAYSASKHQQRMKVKDRKQAPHIMPLRQMPCGCQPNHATPWSQPSHNITHPHTPVVTQTCVAATTSMKPSPPKGMPLWNSYVCCR